MDFKTFYLQYLESNRNMLSVLKKDAKKQRELIVITQLCVIPKCIKGNVVCEYSFGLFNLVLIWDHKTLYFIIFHLLLNWNSLTINRKCVNFLIISIFRLYFRDFCKRQKHRCVSFPSREKEIRCYFLSLWHLAVVRLWWCEFQMAGF